MVVPPPTANFCDRNSQGIITYYFVIFFEANNIQKPIFCAKLEDVMANQKHDHPDLRVPYVLVLLKEVIIKMDGFHTEGIFRYVRISNLLTRTNISAEYQAMLPTCLHIKSNSMKAITK